MKFEVGVHAHDLRYSTTVLSDRDEVDLGVYARDP
jgi:hypothetical protein